jgi:ATP-dependent Lon protease
MLDPIAEPLRDRMEIIELQGYTEEEKSTSRFSTDSPTRKENGVTAEQIEFPKSRCGSDPSLHAEAGVRNLERTIGTICRKQAPAGGRKTRS